MTTMSVDTRTHLLYTNKDNYYSNHNSSDNKINCCCKPGGGTVISITEGGESVVDSPSDVAGFTQKKH